MKPRQLIEALESGATLTDGQETWLWKDNEGYHYAWISVGGEVFHKPVESQAAVLKAMGKGWANWKIEEEQTAADGSSPPMSQKEGV